MTKETIGSYSILTNFDINRTAIECYESLFKNGGSNVSQLAERIQRPRTGLYRVLNQLETKGFVKSLKTTSQPTYFFAEPIQKAILNYANYQRHELQDLINDQNKI